MDFVDSSFELRMGCQGRCLFMNKPLDGWMRVAHVLSSYDVDVLDAHAAAIVIGCDLQVARHLKSPCLVITDDRF